MVIVYVAKQTITERIMHVLNVHVVVHLKLQVHQYLIALVDRLKKLDRVLIMVIVLQILVKVINVALQIF